MRSFRGIRTMGVTRVTVRVRPWQHALGVLRRGGSERHLTVTAVKRLLPVTGHSGCGRLLPLLTLLSILLLVPAAAFAEVPVHVTPSTPDPDSCALCHRAHTATGDMQYQTGSSVEPTGASALVIAPEPDRGDVGLCYLCHGVAVLGASIDVETSMTLSSVHRVAPSTSPTFGPNPKMCSSCHDSHGSARMPDGRPYPALLRAWTSSATTVTAGEEYCDACHQNRSPAGSRYDSLATYKQTNHYKAMLPAVSQTGIRCLNCHVGHGSPIPPLIAGQVKPPVALGALPTETVTANDRTFCEKCHSSDLGTWENSVAYEGSSHAESTTEVVVPGEWPTLGSTRKLGECQVCHAPMGRTGAGGVVIPALAEKPGRQLCDTCHQAAGPASTDLASLAYAGSESSQVELAAVYGPATQTASARVALYGRDPSDANAMLGPREYRIPGAAAIAASGDVAGSAGAELLVADPANGKLTLYVRDDLLGIATSGAWDIDVPITPDFIAVGKFVGSPAKDQIAVVEVSTGSVRVYSLSGSALSQVWAGALPGGSVASGLASGDVTGTASTDLVITDTGNDDLHILVDDGADSMVVNTHDTGAGAGARGPSIGDALAADGAEVVVCNEVAGSISVYDGAGIELGEYLVDNEGGDAVPVASLVANVKGDSAAEVCVALYSEANMNHVNVFERDGAGLSAATAHETGSMYGTGSLAAADLNGDGWAELVVGNGGRWSAGSGMVAPSIQVVRVSFGWLTGVTIYPGGGAELAGDAPALAIADLGPVLPSRHPIDEVAVSHVSTETVPFGRHVTCADCHNPHEANPATTVAPNIEGMMLGSWGVTAAGPAGPTARSIYQYETCYKCHAASVAPQVDPGNASVHAIEASAAASVARVGTFVESGGVPLFTNDSILYCSDCHGNAASPPEPTGGHRSTAAPILKSPILGVGPGASDGLCYDCHTYALFRDGTGDSPGAGSRFRQSAPNPDLKLHARHSGAFTGAGTGLELSCLACHVSHGSTTLPRLLRGDIGYVAGPPNTCTNDCHGGATKTYP